MQKGRENFSLRKENVQWGKLPAEGWNFPCSNPVDKVGHVIKHISFPHAWCKSKKKKSSASSLFACIGRNIFISDKWIGVCVCVCIYIYIYIYIFKKSKLNLKYQGRKKKTTTWIVGIKFSNPLPSWKRLGLQRII